MGLWVKNAFVLIVICLSVFTQGCSYLNSTTTSDTKVVLDQLFKEYDALQKIESTTTSSVAHENEVGFLGFKTQSIAEMNVSAGKLRQLLVRSDQLEIEQLTEQQLINLKLFQFVLKSRVEAIDFQAYLFPMMGDTPFFFELIRLPDVYTIKNKASAQRYIRILETIPNYFEVAQSNFQHAIMKGLLLPKIVVADLDKPLLGFIESDQMLLKPFQNTSFRTEAADAALVINEKVIPALKSFNQFLKEEYIAKAREDIAITSVANGAEYYQSQVNYYTTLNLSADEIHQIGLNEVSRIRREMEQVIASSGFKGNFAEFIEFLRTDPQFYASSAEDLLKEASFIAKKMDAQLPRFFTRLPRQPYGVEPVPEAIAPRYTTGRYVGAPLQSERAGMYWVNTFALDKRPLYVLEALTLHEAVPGHHLQTALAQELENVPDFRKRLYISAFGEGWALYTEKLGIEAGFYKNAYSQFGRLSYEMWRAIRLVVDTGMHTKGWSREKAIQFMADNTALSKHNVTTEIDRYISWPGQALSYKLGEIKIVELRAKAETELGEHFDIRHFHDRILKNGAVTLQMLETDIDKWIEEEKAR